MSNATSGAVDAQVGSLGRAEVLARQLDLSRVVWFASTPSTMDVAHAIATEGAPSGTLVLADEQTAGRGRGGKSWASESGKGLWCTLLERPLDVAGTEALSLRVGLRLARALDRFAPAPVQLKWPNDLMLPTGKLGGILVEARWREGRAEWVAIGVGINLAEPRSTHAGVLRPGTSRQELLAEVVPAVRAAAAARGKLSPGELSEYAARDWARGRAVRSPARGTVAGISPSGAVLIETQRGTVACASGSLVLEEETP
jgi:BirA family transcriptional regulator, biotin operon repressor / biotin---[acetyl-CoA-carboxylase] ligase